MIDPTTHAISEYSMPSQASSPSGFAVGPDGNIWFLDGAVKGDRDDQPDFARNQRVQQPD